MSSANKDTGLQQSCFSLGFPESISCFLIQTTRSRLTCAEAPHACRKKTVPQARQEPAWTGSGQVAPEHQAVSASLAPSHPGQVLSWRPPRGMPAASLSFHIHKGPPWARNFEAFRVFAVAVIIVRSDRACQVHLSISHSLSLDHLRSFHSPAANPKTQQDDEIWPEAPQQK